MVIVSRSQTTISAVGRNSGLAARDYDGYSIHIAIFNSFRQGVYPVGVTDLRSYFTQIIGHNSVNVHRIPTKVGTEIRLNEPFKCAKFQLYWSMHSCFMVDFAKCAK